jgi:predicted ATP-grasp superfamily ATP-dependent carboligase
MTKTVLLTLGRLPKALDIARAFNAVGWRVVVAEPFARHLTGASNAVARSIQITAPAESKQRYLDELARVVEEERVSLVVPVSEETMHVAFLPAFVAPSVRVFTMPPEVVLPLYDKHGFVEKAREYGLAVPESFVLGDPAAADLALDRKVVVKPIHSCSGRGVRVIERRGELPASDSAARSIVQAFVPGDVYSSCTIAHDGRAVATVVYRGVQMSGTVAIAFERVEHPGIEEWIERFVSASGHTGFISFDLVVDSEGEVWGIECNPRATSGVHFLEPETITAAILEPETIGPARFRPERQLQQFYSCLTETQASLFRGRDFGRNLRTLFATRDVTWTASDPWPFLSMTWTSWPIISRSIKTGATFGEVATLDVGWYE